MGNSLQPLLVPPCLSGDATSVKTIINETREKKTLDKVKDLAGPDGSTPLVCAAFKGSAECVKLLLDEGADPLIGNKQQIDAFWVACGYDQREVLEVLISWAKESSKDLALIMRSANNSGDSPLLAAGFKGNVGILGVLTKHLSAEQIAELAEVENNKGDALLSVAVGAEQSEFLEQLVAILLKAGRGEEIWLKRDKRGLCPIHIAAERGNEKVFRQCLTTSFSVLQLCDDPRQDETRGSTHCRGTHALHTACLCGHAAIVELILERLDSDKTISDREKIDFLNQQNTAGQTPYWIASRGRGYPTRDKCRELLEGVAAVDTTIVDDENVSPKEAGERAEEKRAANEERRKAEMATTKAE